MTHQSAVPEVWCGAVLGALEWHFSDATHALLSLRWSTSIEPCLECLRTMREVIDGEMAARGELCWNGRECLLRYERKQRASPELMGTAAAAPNQAVYDSVLMKLRARQRPGCVPAEVFEVLYVDGEPHRVYLDAHGTMRFCGNPIVRRSLAASTYTLNDVMRDNHGHRDVRRFYIEIGYSVDGFLGLTENATVNLSLVPPNPAP